MPQNAKARKDWRRVNDAIHQEEQKLKELQLDYREKVAVVEALKLELRQARNETQGCEQNAIKLAQATIAGHRKLQALQRDWEALQLDRGLLMQQLSAEKDGLETDKVKIKEAEAMFEEELQKQRAYILLLQQQLGLRPQDGDSPASDDVVPDSQPQPVQEGVAAGE